MSIPSETPRKSNYTYYTNKYNLGKFWKAESGMLVQYFTSRNYKYCAILVIENDDLIHCYIYNKHNQIFYHTNAVKQFSKSSLIRCIQMFCEVRKRGMIDDNKNQEI